MIISDYVSSSNLSLVSYNSETQVLDITFHSGSTYRYFGVPFNVYTGLMSAGSRGHYFALYIKNRYRCVRIR